VVFWDIGFAKKAYTEGVRNTIQDDNQRKIDAGQKADSRNLSKEALAQLDTHENNFKAGAGRSLGMSVGIAVGGLIAIMVCAFATGGLALPVIAAIGLACTMGGLITVGGPVGYLAAPKLAEQEGKKILKTQLIVNENKGNEERLEEVSEKTSKKVKDLMSPQAEFSNKGQINQGSWVDRYPKKSNQQKSLEGRSSPY